MYKYWTILVLFVIMSQIIIAQESSVIRIKNLKIEKDSILKIEFFYVPWELKPYGRIGEIDVRDYYGKTSYYLIEDVQIIEEFEETMNILNYSGIEKFNKKYKMDVRMVVDFHYKSGTIKTLLINPDGLVKFEDLYFRGNYYFIKKVLNVVPDAKLE